MGEVAAHQVRNQTQVAETRSKDAPVINISPVQVVSNPVHRQTLTASSSYSCNTSAMMTIQQLQGFICQHSLRMHLSHGTVQ